MKAEAIILNDTIRNISDAIHRLDNITRDPHEMCTPLILLRMCRADLKAKLQVITHTVGPYTLSVREPDVHHNNWGLEIRGETVLEDGQWGCEKINRFILKRSKQLGFNPFHQGGSHASVPSSELFGHCGGWHYWEFWGLSGPHKGDDPYLQLHRKTAVEDLIKEAVFQCST